MGASNYVHIEVKKIKHETDKAFLFLTDDYGEIWVPKTQIADVGDYNVGDEDVEISITEYIAKEKGIDVD